MDSTGLEVIRKGGEWNLVIRVAKEKYNYFFTKNS